LTPEGRRVADQVPPVLADVLNGHLEGFSQAEWEQLLHLLQRMVANGEARRNAKPA
jgi:DNA-binding MarR family transcriptional regulator